MLLTVVGLVTVSWIGAQAKYRRIELVFPFLCALLFSFKDITLRWTLGGGGGQPVFSAAIAAVTSTVEIFLINRYLYGEKFILPPFYVMRWFIGSGLFTGGSFLFMYLAFSLEQVSVVAPLINSYVVFVLLLTPVMARRIESVSWRTVSGAAMVVAGIFLVVGGTELKYGAPGRFNRSSRSNCSSRFRSSSGSDDPKNDWNVEPMELLELWSNGQSQKGY